MPRLWVQSRRKALVFVRGDQPRWRSIALFGVLAAFAVLAVVGVELPGGSYAFIVAFAVAVVVSTVVWALTGEDTITIAEPDGRTVLSYQRGRKRSRMPLDELARVSREEPGEAPKLVLEGLRADRVVIPLGVWLGEERLLGRVSEAAAQAGASGSVGNPAAMRIPRWILPAHLGTTLGTILLVVVLVNAQAGESIGAEPVTPDRVRETLGSTTAPFAGTSACDVYVVPLDRPSEELAAELSAALERRVPVRACGTPSMQLSLSLVDNERRQLDWFATIDLLLPSFRAVWGDAPSTVLGVTAFDTFGSNSAGAHYAFGGRCSFPGAQGFGVISTARMGSGESRFRRLETMAMRYVGFLYFGLEASPDSLSPLYLQIGSLDDLDRMRQTYSDPPPGDDELRRSRERMLEAG